MDEVRLFLCGDLMGGRGIDQVLPHSCAPHLYEQVVKSAVAYVELAERMNGPIPRPVGYDYVWGAALDVLASFRPHARIVNLETSVTTSEEAFPKRINYRMHPGNVALLRAANVDCCVLANNHVLDWGIAGLLETLDTIATAGILVAGAGRDLSEAQAAAVLRLDENVRVLVFAFGSMDSGIPPEWAAGPGCAGVQLAEPLTNGCPACSRVCHSNLRHVSSHVHGRPLFAALALALAAPPALAAQQGWPTVELRPGMVITTSVRVVPRVYRLPAPAALDSAAIVIRGSDITVDFSGATLEGTDPAADPDAAAGVGIRIEGGERVQVRNARVRGYRVGLLARGTRDLSLRDSDFSHNWKPRLFSGVEHESLVDWLSHHGNDNDEWLRFGAGIYLADVRRGEVRGNRIEQGMDGLMLVRCDSLRIWNNVIAFNSGVGIGLYRSSDNRIMHNHASYNVRGYSHGFYRRGQDSAGLLLYEQSSRNVVAFNSMTHGGDGLFLWAGQSTLDTGRGGSNDNLFFANDFSYAPTNAMEATFSRNTFIGNLAIGSEYGLWAGYSFETRVLGNDFRGNRTGIAIEHGQDNVIGANRFAGDSVAIELWSNPVQPSDREYPKQRDTRSRGYRIDTNIFFDNRVAVRASSTRDLTIQRNQLIGVDSAYVLRDTAAVAFVANDTSALHDATVAEWPPLPAHRTLDPAMILPQPLPGGLDVRDDTLAQRDRAAIIVDEWGPYDWRSPKLWPAGTAEANPLPLRVLGPPGEWRVVARRGVAALSRESGAVGDTIVVTPAAGAERDWEVTLEYRGGATVSPRGERRAAGEPYRFAYARFQPIERWNVSFFAWPDSADPRTHPASFAALLRRPPLVTQRPERLDYVWYRPSIAGLPQTRLAAVATSTVVLGPGEYTLRTISDDGIRVWVDDRLVIDDWTAHDSTVDVAPIARGRHELRVEYYQTDGWTELRVEIVRGVQRSTGSPGPH